MSSFHIPSTASSFDKGGTMNKSVSTPKAVLPPNIPAAPTANFADINWNVFSSAGALTESDCAVIRLAETNVLSYVLADRNDAAKYALALLKTLTIKRENQVTHFALTRIIEVLQATDAIPGVSCSAQLFFDQDGDFNANFEPFKDCLESRDDWTRKAAAVAASCISSSCLAATPITLDALVSFVCGQIQKGREGLNTGVPALTVLVKSDKARISLGASGAIGYLTRHLKLSTPLSPVGDLDSLGIQGGGETGTLSAQVLYEITFSLWTLTFSPTLRSDFVTHGTASTLVGLLASSPREKVSRVALAALRNLAQDPVEDDVRTVAGQVFVAELLHTTLLKQLNMLRDRKWSDADITDDIDILVKLLEENFHQLTTWDRYESEVASGSLEWGVTHTEVFWREYSKSMEGNEFRTLKMLIELLLSDDETTVSVAAYDIGEWARFYPNGRSLAKKLGGKDRIMDLMNHTNPEVSRNALSSVSKLMVQKWEFVN